MSTIGVDEHTYALAHSRAYAECLHRCHGDTVEARKLAAYYLRDWYVINDGPTDAELNEPARHDHW